MARTSTSPDLDTPQGWLAPAHVAARLGVSRAQVSRLAVKHAWRRLDVSTGTKGRNQGVRYALNSIEEFERACSY
jgi:hypothetical protein